MNSPKRDPEPLSGPALPGARARSRTAGEQRAPRAALPHPLLALALPALLGALVLLAGCERPPAGAPSAHTSILRDERRFERAGIERIEIANLVGSVNLEPSQSELIEISATFSASSSSEEQARADAELLALDAAPQGGVLALVARFPVGETRAYLDPRAARLGTPPGNAGEETRRTEARYDGQEVVVVHDPAAQGAAMQADLVVRVPRGMSVDVRLVAGEVLARGLDATLRIDLGSGEVQLRELEGPVAAALDTGFMRLEGGRGRIRAKSRNAALELVRFAGEVELRTDAGYVALRESATTRCEIETKSAAVSLEGVSGAIDIESDKGEIEGSGLRVIERFAAGSREGSVSVAGDFSEARSVLVTSESGEVELGLAELPAGRLLASTEEGSLEIELPELEIARRDPRTVEGRLGEGEGLVEVRSESGSVHVYRATTLL